MEKKKQAIIITILVIVILALGYLAYSHFAIERTIITGTPSGEKASEMVETENAKTHDQSQDYIANLADAIKITLNGDTASCADDSVEIKNGVITISSAGAYALSGTLTDGQVIVDTDDEETVTLILNDASINSQTSSAIFVQSAEKVVIALADGTSNALSDGKEYEEVVDNEPAATLFSKSDLTIYGSGDASLTIKGNYKDGISSKDGLIVNGANIDIDAIDDGIRGEDYALIENADITITAKDDGLKSDNAEDLTKGYIELVNSTINITAGEDGISAETDIIVKECDLAINAGKGTSQIDGDTSMKGMKAGVNIVIDNNTINIDATDDAIHSNGTIVINNGQIDLASRDDGIHADNSIEINAGTITIVQSYEGIESALITINGGDIYITASDDGLNVAGGNDGSAMNRMGAGGFDAVQEGAYLYINGGYIYMNAGGDGLDSNGSIVMNGGTAIVNGPTNNGNGPIDYNGTFQMNGGLLIAVGSSGMAQAPGTTSEQNAILVNFTASQQAGTLIHIKDDEGKTISTFAPTKTYQSIAFSSPDLEIDQTYHIYLGGSSTGTNIDGVYTNGEYTPGTLNTSLSLSSVITTSGATGGMRGGMPGGRGGMAPPTMDGTWTPPDAMTSGTRPIPGEMPPNM